MLIYNFMRFLMNVIKPLPLTSTKNNKKSILVHNPVLRPVWYHPPCFRGVETPLNGINRWIRMIELKKYHGLRSPQSIGFMCSLLVAIFEILFLKEIFFLLELGQPRAQFIPILSLFFLRLSQTRSTGLVHSLLFPILIRNISICCQNNLDLLHSNEGLIVWKEVRL